jgi:hypothetical protein
LVEEAELCEMSEMGVNCDESGCTTEAELDSPEFSHPSVMLLRIDHAELWRVQLPKP